MMVEVGGEHRRDISLEGWSLESDNLPYTGPRTYEAGRPPSEGEFPMEMDEMEGEPDEYDSEDDLGEGLDPSYEFLQEENGLREALGALEETGYREEKGL